MSRPIKFRAWDRDNNCWFKPIYAAYKGELSDLLVSMSGELYLHTMSGLNHESMFPNRFVLVQFTGLLDKNGKEIFEGDIVVRQNKAKSRSTGKIIKNGTRRKRKVEFVYRNSSEKGQASWNGWNIVSGKAHEVIGNIYENPELLGKEGV